MPRVQLAAVDSGFARPDDRRREVVDHAGDVVVVEDPVEQLRVGTEERLHHLGALVGRDHAEEIVTPGGTRLGRDPHRATRQRVLQAVRTGLGQLHGDGRPVAVDPRRRLAPAGDVAVVGDGGLAGVRAPDRERHRDRAEHHHGQPAARTGFEVRHLGVRHHAVEVAQVFAHGGHDHPVAQLERADPPRRQEMLVQGVAHVMYSPEFT